MTVKPAPQPVTFKSVAQEAIGKISRGIIIGYDEKGHIGFLTSGDITAQDIMFLIAIVENRVVNDVLASAAADQAAQNDPNPEPPPSKAPTPRRKRTV